MSSINVLLKVAKTLTNPPKILIFDSPFQMAMAYSIWHWTDYRSSDEKDYKRRDLSYLELPSLTDPTNQHPLEEQVETLIASLRRRVRQLYQTTKAKELLGTKVPAFRTAPELQKVLSTCDRHLGRSNVNRGLRQLRPDLVTGDMYDIEVYKSYSHARSRSRFSSPTIQAWWALPHKDAVFVSHPPLYCHSDNQGQLHCKDGPAVAYKDGFEVWAWRGHVLKKGYILNPHTLPFSMHSDPHFEGLYWIEGHKYFYDLAELVGYPYFFKHCKKETLDEDYDRQKQHRQLVRLHWGNFHGGLQLLVLGNGKDRAYLKVPWDIETCARAVAWTFGKTVREYQPAEET